MSKIAVPKGPSRGIGSMAPICRFCPILIGFILPAAKPLRKTPPATTKGTDGAYARVQAKLGQFALSHRMILSVIPELSFRAGTTLEIIPA